MSLLTLHRYRDAVQAFLFFEHLLFGNITHDLDTLDERAGDFVEALWEECESKAFA